MLVVQGKNIQNRIILNKNFLKKKDWIYGIKFRSLLEYLGFHMDN